MSKSAKYASCQRRRRVGHVRATDAILASPVACRGSDRTSRLALKRDDIHIRGDPLDQAVYDAGCAFAFALLPDPAETAQRPGVGFIICHQGASVDYLILSWWDNHNELFQRICIRSRPDGAWETGEGRGGPCVWDAEVIWHEREAYVHHVLSESPDIAGYLGDTPWVSASRGVAAHGP